MHLDEIAAHAEAFEVEWLVLMHRSVRFSAGDAARHVRARLPKDLRERVVLFG
ncbi:MAG: hypothetical protein R3E96_02845 [Planctomycetota bacterium]